MKHFLVFALCLVSSVALAQIPNPGFEAWTGDNPDGWHTTNVGGSPYIVSTDTAHEGLLALRSSVVTSGGFNNISPLWTGSPSSYFFHCDCRPNALRFWYKLQSSGEGLVLFIAGKQGSTAMASGYFSTSVNTDVFTEAVVPIAYVAGGNADSMTFTFSMSGYPSTGVYHQGTFFVIDDLSFGSATAVETLSPPAAALEYIHTANAMANFVYTLNQRAEVSIDVYDVTGRHVKSMFTSTQPGGRYKAVEDVSALASGVYVCKLTVDGQNFSKAFAVTR